MTSPDPRATPPAPRAPDVYNPYAPPGAPIAGAATRRKEARRGRAFAEGWMKWTFFVFGLVESAFLALPVLGVASAIETLGSIFFLLRLGVGLTWLRTAWIVRPFPYEHADVTPGGAVLRLFIPFYGFYWVFAVNLAVARSIDPDRSKRKGVSRSDAINAQMCAMLAATLSIAQNLLALISPAVPAVTRLIGVLAWFGYMSLWESGYSRVSRRARGE